MPKTTSFSTKRLVSDAVFIALYVALSFASVRIGGFKLTIAALPTVLCAVVCGPVDAMLVGLLGAFLEQLLTYGVTPTTALWILPPAVRGLTVSLLAAPQLRRRRYPLFFALCVAAGLLVSCGNTLAFYVDAKLYHYYEYHVIFGVFFERLLIGAATSLLTAAPVLPLARALAHAGLGGGRAA